MPVVMVSHADRARRRGHAARAGARRGRLRRQAEDRRGRRPAAGWPTTSPTRSASRRARRCAGWPRRAARRAAAARQPPAPGLAPMGRLSTEKLDLHRRLHRRHRSDQGGADGPAGRLRRRSLITQHMPPGFTTSYAQRLDGLCRIRVKEASDGERVLPGHAYIAPGGLHLSVERSGRQLHRARARRRAGEPPQAVGRGAVRIGRARGRAPTRSA